MPAGQTYRENRQSEKANGSRLNRLMELPASILMGFTVHFLTFMNLLLSFFRRRTLDKVRSGFSLIQCLRKVGRTWKATKFKLMRLWFVRGLILKQSPTLPSVFYARVWMYKQTGWNVWCAVIQKTRRLLFQWRYSMAVPLINRFGMIWKNIYAKVSRTLPERI